MKFLSNSTKVKCIVASVLTGLAFITLIMLTSLLTVTFESKLTMTFIYTISLMLILLIWQGILQINVFTDYKAKRNYLCADGILILCMGALIIISGILLSVLQLDKIMHGIFIGTSDIRIFLTCFLSVIGIWKIFVTVRSIKEKHFNWWCELLFSILWIGLAITCLLTMFISSQALLWIMISVAWALIVTTIFYMLYSYVIKKPTYLETEEAIKELEEQIEEKQAKKEKDQKLSSSFRLQDKLRKLKELKDTNLITEEEYNQKKNQLLETL
jgi:hypothetical protein